MTHLHKAKFTHVRGSTCHSVKRRSNQVYLLSYNFAQWEIAIKKSKN